MKRILIFLCVILIMLSLSGCAASKSFSPLAHEYLISAIGFDMSGDKKRVILEAVIVNSEDSQAERKTECLTGDGGSLQAALNKATEQAAQPIELSHCAVAVIGGQTDSEYLEEIYSFLQNEKQITLSILLISTNNAEQLLSQETVASVAVGYDIVSMLQTKERLSGIDYKNRFYQLEAKRLEAVNVFSLPNFSIASGGYTIDGISVFKNNSPVMHLDNSKASVYAVATDSQNKGKIIFDEKPYDIESVFTVCRLENKNLPKIVLEAKIEADNKRELKKLIKTEIEELFTLSQSVKLDIFGLGNTISHKETGFFEKIQKNYDKFYRNAELEVIIK